MTLHLSLYAEYFAAILAGTKGIEYRRRCDRWDKMLSRPYQRVKFINGYGNHRPWLICEVAGIEQTPEQWLIYLGAVLESGNLELLNRSSRAAPST